jgi:hypothetical protein
MDHAELTDRARRWLVEKGCFAVATERGDATSRADVVGWAVGGSIAVEVKAHRGDYLREASKAPSLVGLRRYYAFPAGSNGAQVAVKEVPERFGVIWIDCVKVVVKRKSSLFAIDATLELRLLLAALGAGNCPPAGVWDYAI